jgi:hypothetical protein
MTAFFTPRFGLILTALALFAGVAARADADEIWVAPTYQQDIGGLGVASNLLWPVTPFGVTRMALAIPGNLQTLQSAKVAIIPGATAGGPPALNFFICAAANGDTVVSAGNCFGPFAQAFTSVANQLAEVEIGAVLAQHLGTPGATYVAVLAFTTPGTATDHVVGLRFSYAPALPSGVATLGANTFTGTQTAPAFVGSGAGLTNLPFPSGAATLGANTFTGTQTAPAFSGSGTGLTGVAKLTTNTFTGTQTIDGGNLDLDASTATAGNITKNGTLFLHNTGTDSVYLGLRSGALATGGATNAAVGFEAMKDVTTGGNNSGLGARALTRNTTGANNTAVGLDALSSNTTGGANTGIGVTALASSNGDFNTAVGLSAMQANSSGDNNTAVGSFALTNNQAGNNNVAVGSNAGVHFPVGSGNIYLGANVSGVGGESNAMYLGKVGTLTKTVIGGVRGVTTVNANAIPVLIDSAGQLGTISSSIRFKEDVHDMADASRRLLQLRPVTFHYTQPFADGAKPLQFGLIAEEVANVFPELAVRDANGIVETVHYETLNVLLLNELKKDHDELDQQKHRIEVLEERLNDLLRSGGGNARTVGLRR